MLMLKMEGYRAQIAEMAEAANEDEIIKQAIVEMLAEAGIIEPPKKWEPPKPCPTTIAAAELSIFDNWKGKATAQKSKPYRWAVSLKVWTKNQKIDWRKPYFIATVTLFDAKSIYEKATDLKRKSLLHPISEEYAATVTDLIAPLMDEAGYRGGLLYTKQHGRGTFYHDHQLLLIDAKELESRSPRAATLIVDGETRIAMEGFSNRDASGKKLSGNCIAQCRYIDPDDAVLSKSLASWSTQNLY
ncbi:hypothetical protein SAMN05518849_11651 [Sphingobium sp. AP50]|uniref:hypothetical protein n=1 Tax=Sphingobium sp. AP50 TaxID=1884369 RepID=UPI0008B2D5D2|nr:hypothetical protein [Sphingobium sp. AP50]SEJ87050.1 hypothetical protein SAMN05518849_11651 [Sphingobium sp. AP50]